MNYGLKSHKNLPPIKDSNGSLITNDSEGMKALQQNSKLILLLAIEIYLFCFKTSIWL